MIFSELYGAYYNALAAVLKAAVERPLTSRELRAIIAQHAFGESVLNMEPALMEERWQLLHANGTTSLHHPPVLPYTTMQKRWLNAIMQDPRMRLFTDETVVFPGVAPLFRQEDIVLFDRYEDGDPYDDPAYIARFRIILQAVGAGQTLRLKTVNRKGNVMRMTVQPIRLEYSEKDDKFRLICANERYGSTVNLGRILQCKPVAGDGEEVQTSALPGGGRRTVTFTVENRRNALERAMLHFAHFKKQATRIDDMHYTVQVAYDKNDETEMVIRLLAFGPLVKVTEPASFVELIRQRLVRQQSCEL